MFSCRRRIQIRVANHPKIKLSVRNAMLFGIDLLYFRACIPWSAHLEVLLVKDPSRVRCDFYNSKEGCRRQRQEEILTNERWWMFLSSLSLDVMKKCVEISIHSTKEEPGTYGTIVWCDRIMRNWREKSPLIVDWVTSEYSTLYSSNLRDVETKKTHFRDSNKINQWITNLAQACGRSRTVLVKGPRSTSHLDWMVDTGPNEMPLDIK